MRTFCKNCSLMSLMLLTDVFYVKYVTSPKLLSTMDYCSKDPSQTLRCLADTIRTSLTAAFLLIFGAFQLYLYRKYSTPHRYVDQMAKSKLFYLQICLSVFVPALVLVEFILQSVYGGKFYGFMVTRCCSAIVEPKLFGLSFL